MESTKRPLEEEEASEEFTHAGCTAQKYSFFVGANPWFNGVKHGH